MASPLAISTPRPDAVAAHLKRIFSDLGWRESALIDSVIADVVRLFSGDWPGYCANDLRYHDLVHTMQATVCAADILEGQVRAGGESALTRRDGEMTVIAALLHDTGFIRRHGDDTGTGAKYTFIHEQRSCDFARGYLPGRGFTEAEIADVCSAISCTGPRNRITQQTFSRPVAKILACIVVTADYLAQLAAPEYPDKLDILYGEFLEAFESSGVPPEKRPYQSARELKQKTPGFWQHFVLPVLDNEADGVHRYLTVTGQANPYFAAVEANLAEIKHRVEQELAHT